MPRIDESNRHAQPNDPIVVGDTLPDIFWNAVTLRGSRVMMRQKELGIWRGWTWAEVGALVRDVTMGYASLGLKTGDCVSVLCNTRAEWVWCDLAALSMGCISNGIYPTLTPAQTRFVCADSRTRVLIVEDEEQLDKALEIRQHLHELTHIVLMNARGLAEFSDPTVLTLESLRRLGAAYDAAHPGAFDLLRRGRSASDLAVLVYTAGVTQAPRGVMLSHRNLVALTRAQSEPSTAGETDERICFLPLSHIVERVSGIYASICTGARLNFVENPDTVPENVREIGPTILSGTPRLWHRFYSSVIIAVQESGAIQRALYSWALSVGAEVAERRIQGRPSSALLKLKYHLAGIAALNNVRRYIGIHRCRYLVSSGAPIATDLLRWYFALGVPMFESWGRTETAGIVTLMPVDAVKVGTVGRAISGCEIRCDENSGELLVRGASVFKGYLNDPDRTAQTVDADGWLHTGDAGTVDEAGYVRVNGRLSDMIVTQQGYSVAPAEWENALKISPYVTDAIVIGHRRAYLTAIVMIEQETVEKFAQEHDVPFSNYTSLARSLEVRSLIQREVDRVNERFASSTRILRFVLFDTRLGPEDEELTPTMKLKRELVQTKYATQIETMYS